MHSHHRRKRSRKRRYYTKGSPLFRWGTPIVALVLICLAFAWWRGYFSTPELTLDLEKDGANTIQTIASTTSVSQLSALSENATAQFDQSTAAEKIILYRILAASAKRRLELANDNEVRNASTRDYLAALQELVATPSLLNEERLNYEKELRTLTEEHRNNPDSAVLLDVYFALLRTALLNKPTPNAFVQALRGVEDLVREIADRFPDNPNIIQPIDHLIDGLPNWLPTRPEYTQLLRNICAAFDNSTNPEIQKWISSLREREFFLESKIVSKLFRAEQGDNAALNEAKSNAMEILDKDATEFGVGLVINVAHFLERANQRDDSRALFEKIIETLKQLPKTPKTEELDIAAHDGLRRLDLIGQSLSFAEVTLDDVKLTSDELKGSAVALIFVSSKEEANEANRKAVVIADSGTNLAKFVIVGSGISPKEMRSIFTKRNESVYLLADPTKSSKLATDCRIPYTPYITVLNQNGIVERIGVPLKNLTFAIEDIVFPKTAR